jgi:hypothetical protein
MAGNFNCVLNENQFELAFPKQVGTIPTFGFVKDEADWEVQKNDPKMMAPGMPTGIGQLKKFKRQVFTSGKLNLPDGTEVPHWGFKDDTGVETLPSPVTRVMAGDLAQVHLQPSKNRHTIHHHGIEPDSDNDGVGHTSFEVLGNYTYQWRPHLASSGTFFYHCHVNTVLHVQMGLFGGLIIDPYEPEPHPDGPKPMFDAPDSWRYQHERVWVPYSVVPEWHTFHHLAGFCGEDAGLNDFNPRFFGFGKHFQTADGAPVMGTAEEPVALTMPVGETAYIRIIQSQYHPVEFDLGALGEFVSVAETDGRGIRPGIDLDGLGTNNKSIDIPWKDWSPHRMSSAQRLGLLVKPTRTGTFPVELTFRHWVTNKKIGYARTLVTVV